MKTNLNILLIFFITALTACAQNKKETTGTAKKDSTISKTTLTTNEPKEKLMENEKHNLNITDEEWKKKLTPEQYEVLREKGTERAFTGKYWDTKDKGVYSCAGCGTDLFTSDQKFSSECGWPSFDEELGKGEKIIKKKDLTYGMSRTEIICAKCGGHLGHIFDDGPTETGKRYCVNSASLNLIKK